MKRITPVNHTGAVKISTAIISHSKSVIISLLSPQFLDRNQFYHRLRHDVGLVRHTDCRHQALDRPNTIDYQ